MIARNYIRYPETLRFQVEMFSNGYKNSPRIMRLMTVIFDWKISAPAWVKEAAAAAKRLVKLWKAAQIALNFKDTSQDKKASMAYKPNHNFTPSLETDVMWNSVGESWEYLPGMAGVWVSYCQIHQPGKRGFAGQKQCVKGYGLS